MTFAYAPQRVIHRRWDERVGRFARRIRSPLSPWGWTVVATAAFWALAITALVHGFAVGAAHGFRI